MKTKLEFRNSPAQYGEGKAYYLMAGWLQPIPKLPDCIVTVCAWCDKDKSLTQKLTAAKYTVSHGICEKCSANEIKKLN